MTNYTKHPSFDAPKCVDCRFYTPLSETLKPSIEAYINGAESDGSSRIDIHKVIQDIKHYASYHRMCHHPIMPRDLVNGMVVKPNERWQMRQGASENTCGEAGELFETINNKGEV
jgi:hypothetical protein